MAEKDPRLTQRRLSKETKLSVTTVNRLHNNDFERDTATINTLNNFGCDVGELFVCERGERSERDHSLAGSGAS